MVTELTQMYKFPVIRRIAYLCIKIFGCEIPVHVKIGRNVKFVHDCPGTVIHQSTIIKNNVKIYQNVTIGRGNIWEDPAEDFKGFIIEEGAVICAGAKIISSHGTLVVGKNTVVAANAVLTTSTGEDEIWGGYRLK